MDRVDMLPRCEQEEKSLLHKGQLLTLESKVEAATRGDNKGFKTTAAEEKRAGSGSENTGA